MRRNITLWMCILCLGLITGTASAQSCTATISYTDSASAGGTISYTFTAVGTFYAGTQFTWSFGDGSSGQGQTISHDYSGGANMAYEVTLIVSDSTHGCSYIIYDTIYPTGYVSPCSAYFSPTNVDTLFTLATVNTGVAPFTYQWDLPDGTTSSLPDPTYTIGSTGSYSGIVIVTDSTGCTDTVPYTISYANAGGSPACQAYFYVVPDTTVGMYTAVDCSTGGSLSYDWSFGDGDTSTQQYPTHTYAVPGYYTLCLTIVSANGCTSTFCDSSFYAAKNSAGPMSGINVISKSQATGIQPILAAEGISIYPNPAQSTLALHVSGNDQIQKSIIYNTDGQQVSESGSAAIISIGQLAAGLYLIEVRTGSGSYRASFVKE